MSKEDGERPLVEERTSSVPPRPASQPPRPASSQPPRVRAAPSAPPATETVDTDWSATPAQPPSMVVAEPAQEASVPAQASVLPAQASVPAQASSPPQGTPDVRPNRTSPLRSKTLIGMAVPLPARSTVPPANAPAGSTEPPVQPASIASTAATARHSPLRSQTLIGISPFAPAALAPAPAEPAPTIAPSERGTPTVVGGGAASVVPSGPSATRLAAEGLSPSAPPATAAGRALEAGATLPAAEPSRETPRSSTLGPEAKASPNPAAPGPRAEKNSGRGIVLLAAAGLGIGLLGYHFLHGGAHSPPDLAVLPVPPAVATPAAAVVAPDPTSAAREPAASATAADFPVAPLAAPAAAASGAPASPPANSAAAAVGTRQVTITTVPPKAKFYHYGKLVGTSPFVVQLPPGEKRAYEVYVPGHITRRLVVDGSKPEIMIGLSEKPRSSR